MNVAGWRGLWLWAAAAILLNGAPARADCIVPTISGGNVRGRIYDLTDNHHPPAGATVRLTNESGKVVAEAAAEQDGRFAISAPEKGRYRLTVTALGFTEVSANLKTKKPGKNAPPVRVDLGKDPHRPCGGGGITVEESNSGAVGR